ncbi:hypothetical protein [Paraclostridium sordellii]|uniref:hypothetical protein n=1 Tax=Paraclostridium sordellii TaxID=1505 RepID=UPI0005E5F6E6|nr:hypothetical protein [Paeniclostridium sordellii]CEO23061.1 Uncharacterised protein [[Clostridium] sordellii] [Paeniclostridium sordellii]
MNKATNSNISYISYSTSACGISYSNNSSVSSSMSNIMMNNNIVVDKECKDKINKITTPCNNRFR